MRKLLFFSVAALLVAGFVAPGWVAAQTQFGTVTGRVVDAQQAAVPDAKLTLTNLATNTKQETQTNDEGIYVVANVVAGSYEIAIEKEGFRRTTQRFAIAVAETAALNFTLQLGQVTETVTVSEAAATINTVSGEISREISGKDLETLPLLTRNPYALVAMAPGAVDSATATGDTRGLGIVVAGGRSSSMNFLLDGAENNETFVTGPSTLVPVDAVQEFRVQAANMSAQFGRNTLVTNVITKSGSNEFHGSAYEYYRGSALSTETFDDKARGLPKSGYVRNLFGASGGGRILRDKTFFFGSFEGLRIRSSGNNNWFVPTQDFVNNSAPNMQDYVTGFGGLPANDCARLAISAEQVVSSETGDPLINPSTGQPNYGSDATHSLFNPNTGALIPASTPLFCATNTVVPIDAGGGLGQNAWSVVGRIDHHFTQNTALSGRYAYYDQKFPVGAGSDSPFTQFQTPASFRSQNITLTLTHSFNPRIFNETRGAYSRTFPDAPLGQAPVTATCVQYGNRNDTPTGDPIVFPGYLPNLCGGFSIPSGGPQNTYSGFTGFTWVRGRHTFKWGAYTSHLRDNHTFGAFANASANVAAAQSLLDGVIDSTFSVAIDPKGKFPGQAYNQNVDGPFVPPSFTRHFRYNEVAFYGEDEVKLTSRLTATLGLRWEYFGVLHSPDEERFLDANLYLDAVGIPKALDASKTIFEQVRDARFSRTNNFFNQDWNNFGPRVGLAWDLFGNHRTVLRAGYGIYYDKNFGNALFNAIQNFPNYAVLTLQTPFPVGASGPIDPNQYVTLANLAGPGNFTLTGSARMLERQLETAYNQQWNLTLEHDILGRGVIASVSYVGVKGDKLYSLNNLNQRGSCLLLPAQAGGPCAVAGPGSARLNTSGVTGMNRRANEGFSRYHAMNTEVRTRQIPGTGLTLTGAYTWARSIDNASSFFNDSVFDGQGNFGFRDPFNPAGDRGSSSNDIRHRYAMSWNWEIPWGKDLSGIARQALGGWSITGTYVAQTGGAFSVYDMLNFTSQCSISFTNACYPVQTGSVPAMDGKTPDPNGGPNTFVLYDVSNTFITQGDFCASAANPLDCTARLYLLTPELLESRNQFRLPGFWNVDAAVLKDFPLSALREGMKLQFRAEFFNLFNHANLYGDPDTVHVFDGGGTQIVQAKRGVRPGQVFGVAQDRRNIQLALRLNW